ncbi:MAG: DivIVA domain-containing protein [Ruminiclostridium sp.]|nr:DivIVA domain-containing protein [Ruminiclostridium sp.]
MNAKDIVEKRFETVKKGGYNIDDVDRFLRDVSVEYLGIQKENEELEEKLKILAEKIKEYRNDEDALRDALLIAKKQAIAVENEAKAEAEKIIKEAKEKAEKIVKDATEDAAKEKEQSDKDVAAAKEKAKNIVADANAKSDEIHLIMQQRTEREQIVLQRTKKEVADYTAKILAAYNAHIEYIKGIPAQCENEFVINTVKEVESRKPEDSAFAKKPEPKKEEAKPAPAKEEAKKEEAKPAPAKEEAKKEEVKPAPAKEEPKKEEVKPAPEKEEPKKEEVKPAEEKKEESKKSLGDSILFKLGVGKGEKKDTHENLEFGQKSDN